MDAHKRCKYDRRVRCFYESCGFLDLMGNVRICRFHPNPRGRFTRKEVIFIG